jgi:hypothetical protein
MDDLSKQNAFDKRNFTAESEGFGRVSRPKNEVNDLHRHDRGEGGGGGEGGGRVADVLINTRLPKEGFSVGTRKPTLCASGIDVRLPVAKNLHLPSSPAIDFSFFLRLL